MKKYHWCFFIVLLTFIFINSGSCEWYSDGNLHKSTLKQWKQASSSNKLGTAADWALTCPKIKKKVLKSGSMDTLKPYAINLLNCLDEASTDPGYSNMSASEMASLCMISLGWFK